MINIRVSPTFVSLIFQAAQLIQQQLKPYLNQLTANEICTFVNTSSGQNLIDENVGQRLFERAMNLFMDNDSQINLQTALEIVDSVVPMYQTLSKKYLAEVQGFLSAVASSSQLKPSQLARAAMINGKLCALYSFENKQISKQLKEHLYDNVSKFDEMDLRLASVGFSMAHIADKSVWQFFEHQVLELNKQVAYGNLSRIGTAFAMANEGSARFWKYLEERTISDLKDQTPEVIGVAIQFYTQTLHGTPQLYEEFEKVFLNRSSEFNQQESVTVFSSFARVQFGSIELWTQFETDLPGFMKDCGHLELQMLVYEVMKILPKLSNSSIGLITDYIKSNQINDALKERIESALDRHGYLTPDLERALEK